MSNKNSLFAVILVAAILISGSKEEITHDLTDEQVASIQEAPSFLINDQLVYEAQPFKTFKEIIANALDYESSYPF